MLPEILSAVLAFLARPLVWFVIVCRSRREDLPKIAAAFARDRHVVVIRRSQDR